MHWSAEVQVVKLQSLPIVQPVFSDWTSVATHFLESASHLVYLQSSLVVQVGASGSIVGMHCFEALQVWQVLLALAAGH